VTWQLGVANFAISNSQMDHIHEELHAEGWANPAVLTGIKVAAIPSLCMIVGSLAVILSPGIPDTIKTASQNLSAGLLISVISGELWPVMINKDAQGVIHYTGLSVGFMIGLIIMYAMKELFPEDDEDEDKEEHDSERGYLDRGSPSIQSLSRSEFSEGGFKRDLQTMTRLVAELQEESNSKVLRDNVDRLIHELEFSCDMARRHLRGTRPFEDSAKKRMREHVQQLHELLLKLTEKAAISSDLAGIDKALAAFEKMIVHLHDHAHRQGRFRRWGGKTLLETNAPSGHEVDMHAHGPRGGAVPCAMIVAVIVDSFNDGLLIGLSCAVSYKAGLTMAAATCIEMGFLGFSFTAQLAGSRLAQRSTVAISMVPAVVMVLAGAIGATLGSISEDHPEVFVGFVSFSVVALLFVVVHELLAEAIEMREVNELWYVNICIFVGLFMGIVIEKIGG